MRLHCQRREACGVRPREAVGNSSTSSNTTQCRFLSDQEPPADQDATQSKKRFMDIGTLLVADSQSAKLVNPGKTPFHNPAASAEATAVLRVPHRE